MPRRRKHRKNKPKIERTPSPQCLLEQTLVVTPVNYNRSFNHRQSSFNITNLNVLFDSPPSALVVNSPITKNNLLISSLERIDGDKWLSPVTSRRCNQNNTPHLAILDKSTPKQYDLIVSPRTTDITTPKVSQVRLIEKTPNEFLNNKKLPNNISNNKITKFNSNEVNINPYLNVNEIKVCQKDQSLGAESSILSLQQFGLNPSSTPIEKGRNVVEDVVVEDEKRMSPVRKGSPRVNFSSRRSFLEVSGRKSPVHLYERLFTRLKRYSRVSVRWSNRMLELCAQLGITLKNMHSLFQSLSTICNNLNNDHSKDVCRCEEYREKIGVLNTKITELNCELTIVKNQIDEQKENKEVVTQLQKDIILVKQELNQISELKLQLEMLKQRFQGVDGEMLTPQSSRCCSLPPPIPPPPPPPPPPPTVKENLKIERKKNGGGGSFSINGSASRPIISLDDILKVKLKKTSDRLSSSASRRSSEPVISMGKLRPVNLKPTRRPPIRSSPDNPTNLTTSPCSSLSRILSDNSSTVRRVKRLQKDRCYTSLHSVYRNPFLKRERDDY